MAAAKRAVGLTGGCQCGAVRYRLDAAPRGSNICHCRMCQKAGGAPFMAFAGVPPTNFVVTRGAHRDASPVPTSPNAASARDCGTPLTYRGNGARPRQRDDRQPRRPDGRRAGMPARRRIADCTGSPASLALPAMTSQIGSRASKIATIGNRQHPDHET